MLSAICLQIIIYRSKKYYKKRPLYIHLVCTFYSELESTLEFYCSRLNRQ